MIRTASIVLLAFAALAHARQPAPPPEGAAPTRFAGDAYYLSQCVICKSLLGSKGDTSEVHEQHRTVRLCSPVCAASFRNDTAEGWLRVDRALIADQTPHYPLRTSIVSNAPLTPQAIDVICENRLFRVNTPAERDAILRDPRAYFHALDRAVIEMQRPTYGMPTKCPVQGDILDGDTPIDLVVANRMIRVCCSDCARTVRAHPSQYLALVDYANRHPAPSAPPRP